MRIPLVMGVVFCAAAPLLAGIEVVDQTARATGMGGAYVAQAGDPSAIYFNPGGLGLMAKKKGAAAGATITSFRNFTMQGTSGLAAGTTAQLKENRNAIPYLFVTLPLGARGVFGVGAYTPFRLHNEWLQPATFAGRGLARTSSIDTTDIAPTVGFQLTPSLGIGAGAIYRTTKITVDRNVSTTFNGSDVDVASLRMQTDSKSSIGWNAGVLYRPAASFSLGASYRSGTKNDFTGAGTLTQIATGNSQLDQLVAATFPFAQNLGLTTHLELPAQANVGIAFGSQPFLFEVDATRTSWKKTTDVSFNFPNNPTLNSAYPLSFKDTTSYRAGLRYQMPTGPIFRVGYAIEKSPQPNETVGPFIADADRNTVTAGFGLDWLDLAVGWSRYGSRSITTNVNQFNGNYRGNAWTFAITATK